MRKPKAKIKIKLRKILEGPKNSRKLILRMFYMLDFFYSGERFRLYSDDRGLPLDSESRAEYLSFQIQREIEDHVFDPAKYRRAEAGKYWTTNLLDKFYDAKKREIAPSYQGNYKRMVDTAKAFFSTKDVREIKKIDLINYKNSLEARSVSIRKDAEQKIKMNPKTIKNYLTHFKVFMNWLITDPELISIIPNFPAIDVAEPAIKWVGGEDQIKLYQQVPAEDKPLLGFLMLQGCRPSEARALKVRDVDLKSQTIRISATWSGATYRERRKGKKAKAVVVPIHQELFGYLEDRVKSSLPGAWLFPNPRTGDVYSVQRLRKVWTRIQRKANIGGLTLYQATRHSFASQLVNQGVSIFEVAKLMGHSDIQTTQKYTHPDVERQRTTLEKLSLTKIVTVHDLAMEEKEAKIAK